MARNTSSGDYPVEINWTELDAGADAAYLNETDRRALIWLNLLRTRPALFSNIMQNDNDPETTGIGIWEAQRINEYFPEWKLGTSKALYIAVRELAAQFAAAGVWDTNKYNKGFTQAHYIAGGSVGYFYVVDGNSVEAFISQLQTQLRQFMPYEGGQWHQMAANGRGPEPDEANMAAVAVQGTICVIAFGKNIIDKPNLPDNIVAGNDEKLYYQYAGDRSFADLQNNESFGITAKDDNRIWDLRNFLKNKALEIVGDAQTGRQKTERLLRWIIDTFEYDYGYNANTQNALDILGRLIDHNDNHIICYEYARLMTAVCRVMGIKARYIEGLAAATGSSEWRAHAWVQVFFDGKWNMCDPTWNDTGGQSGTLLFFPGAAIGDYKHLLRF
ncbi:MAG: hypothetical protein LBC67_03805 [Spirochaetales bacterium]|nr:hypothetical protein [Spirochaetales bacterium]